MGNTKWVHLMFAVGGLLLVFLLMHAVEWAWSYFAKPRDIFILPIAVAVGGAVTLWGWRNEQLFGKAQDIVQELMKVTWPTRKETSAATMVVIVTVVVFSIVLGIFDMIWSWATGALYG